MERRQFLAAISAGALAFAAASSNAASAMSMHPAKYQSLQEAAGHCVTTANDCMRHCTGMMAMNDYTMTGCINTAYQVVAACGALQTLAALNSPQTPAFAKATAELCVACQTQCEKFPDVEECKACAASCKACAEECRKAAA